MGILIYRLFPGEESIKVTPEEEKILSVFVYSRLISREGVFEKLNNILDYKPKHHYTTHDALPKEVVQDNPSIAYLVEEDDKDYSVSYIYSVELMDRNIQGNVY